MSRLTSPLQPAMPSSDRPEWPGALWIGTVDDADLPTSGPEPTDPPVTVALASVGGYAWARLLVRSGPRVRGFVDVPLTGGSLDLQLVVRQARHLPPGDEPPTPIELPAVSVVLCTHDRPGALAVALASVLAQDYPDFEVVVVDNAPSTGATAEYLSTLRDPRLRVVTEPVAGLSRARNLGVLTARGAVLAFTDDDVVADPGWLRGLAAGFARDDRAGCVSGLVPTGEVRTRTQAWFDSRVTWSDAVAAKVYSLDAPPPGMPLFPFQVGLYGTGANFALRRDLAVELGGFDEALGVGTPTGGGEDIDMFTRVLLAGHALVVEPSAVVWHRHRTDLAALRTQARGYGLGLGAWLTKICTDPRTAAMVARRGLSGVRRLFDLGGSAAKQPAPVWDTGAGAPPTVRPLDLPTGRDTAGLHRLELLSAARGPFRYLAARSAGALATPLRPPGRNQPGP